jgi:hypothetical protein
MTNKLPARDLERVSAYLDNELSSGERATFEQRLKNEPNLSRAFTELKTTRTLLRRALQRRVPRSFAIRPESVLEKKPANGAWTRFNLVSAAATFLLVLVFAGDIWVNGLPLDSFGASAPEEAPQALMAQEATIEEEPAAGDTVISATPTVNPAEDYGEIERFAVPENEIGEKAPVTFDPRLFLTDNARPLEFALAAVAIFAGVLAWWRRRNP